MLSFPFQTLQKGCLLSHFSSPNKQGDPLLLEFTETALIKGIDDLHVVQSKGQTSVLACQKRLTQLTVSTGLLASASPLSHRRFPSLHQTGSVPLATPTPSVLSVSLVASSETCVLRTPEFTSPVWTQDSTRTHPAPP